MFQPLNVAQTALGSILNLAATPFRPVLDGVKQTTGAFTPSPKPTDSGILKDEGVINTPTNTVYSSTVQGYNGPTGVGVPSTFSFGGILDKFKRTVAPPEVQESSGLIDSLRGIVVAGGESLIKRGGETLLERLNRPRSSEKIQDLPTGRVVIPSVQESTPTPVVGGVNIPPTITFRNTTGNGDSPSLQTSSPSKTSPIIINQTPSGRLSLSPILIFAGLGAVILVASRR